MDNFLLKQQALALEVARLPIFRYELEEARKMVEVGHIGNAAAQHTNYLACVNRIKQLVANM